ISGNSTGLQIDGLSHPVIGGTYNSLVQGNVVGLKGDGSGTLANARGIVITNADNLIGGTTAAARNVISGNPTDGIPILSATAARANAQAGVRIEGGAHHNTVGGSPGQRNVISGNTLQGINIKDTGSDFNWVAGNYVGTDVTGLLALGNGSNAVWITLGAQHN